MIDIKPYELVLYSGRRVSLTEFEYQDILRQLKAGNAGINLPDGSLIGKGNVQDLAKRQMTMADTFDERKALPAGDTRFNPDGAGYKKFLKVWAEKAPISYKKHLQRLEKAKDDKRSDNHLF